nr:UDP-2,4-diacetamido-2,4,6-trideoxy-beta-L-altropyranose hydrolase [uncultured Acetatifactor sp.]
MIWIRADANETIGSGHVMRCLSIADALKQQGQQVCFLTADENAAGLLEARGQAFRVLHTDYRRMEGELEALEELLAGGGFFLADSYFVTAAYLDRVRERLPVGYLDDMCRRDLAADLLIDYNIFAEARLYEGCKAAEFLLGPEYAPLRAEFAGNACETRARASRVLITTGGGDRYNLAGQLLEKALAHPGTACLEYHVVSGAYNVHLAELKALERRHGNLRIYSNVSDMCGLMRDSDIAVTAGGSTMYELSALGVPMVCFSFVDNQERIVEGFVERGLVGFGGNYLLQGEAMAAEAAEAIALLAGDRELRQTYSRRLQAVVDGRGAMRIARRIIQKSQEGAQSVSQSAWQIAD